MAKLSGRVCDICDKKMTKDYTLYVFKRPTLWRKQPYDSLPRRVDMCWECTMALLEEIQSKAKKTDK